MKTNLILFFISLTVFGCDKSSNKEYLFTKDFLQDNAGWEIEKDTISKTLVFEKENFKLPLEVIWVPAIDENHCYRIGYMRIKRMDSNKKINVSNFSVSNIPCAMKWESEDQRRFESILMKCTIETKVGIKEYNFDGTIGTINGLGEIVN